MRAALIALMLFFITGLSGYSIPLNPEYRLIIEKSVNQTDFLVPYGNKGHLFKSLKILGIEIYQFYDVSEIHEFIEFNHLAKTDYVFNLKLEQRALLKSEPNDPHLPLQWYLKKISSLRLRDEYERLQARSTGKFTIGVIDNGILTSHEDLKTILWRNTGEIENDGIDNDGNGYIDDYYGYSTEISHHMPVDSIEPHGTRSAGIASAQTNNKKGIASPGDQSSLLFCSYGKGLVSDLLECYEYMAMQKKRYLETKGRQGVNIITINLSSGIRFAKPKDFPLLCNVYDKLGNLGSLSVCVAPNQYINVDEEGDVPSGCESEYIITETFTDQNDMKEYNSGFGKKSIDLGVPGKDLYSTFPAGNSSYNYYSGNSAAGPLLAGSIGQLYELPCYNLDSFAMEYPGQSALLVKEAILKNTDYAESLTEYTKFSGRLNVFKAYHFLKTRLCDRIFDDIQIKVYTIPGGQIKIEGLNEFNQGDALTISIINELGQIEFSHTKKYPAFMPILIQDKVLNTGIYFISIENAKSRVIKKFFTTGM